jgi:hypothetical protein
MSTAMPTSYHETTAAGFGPAPPRRMPYLICCCPESGVYLGSDALSIQVRERPTEGCGISGPNIACTGPGPSLKLPVGATSGHLSGCGSGRGSL